MKTITNEAREVVHNEMMRNFARYMVWYPAEDMLRVQCDLTKEEAESVALTIQGRLEEELGEEVEHEVKAFKERYFGVANMKCGTHVTFYF